jgi:hypothetical protein
MMVFMISLFLLYEQLSKISLPLLMSLIVGRTERLGKLAYNYRYSTHPSHHYLGLFIDDLTEEAIRKKFN